MLPRRRCPYPVLVLLAKGHERAVADPAEAMGCASTQEPAGCLACFSSGSSLYSAVLSGKQRRHLRALAHDLRPTVQVGKGGIDDGLIAAVDQALTDHELIKVKVGESAGLDRHDAAEAVATRTKSEVAQVLGNTVILYRAHPEKPTIVLPAAPQSDAPDEPDEPAD